MPDPELKTRVMEWLEHNRTALPLNSRHWELLCMPYTVQNAESVVCHLGKYDALVQDPDFFYKAISKML